MCPRYSFLKRFYWGRPPHWAWSLTWGLNPWPLDHDLSRNQGLDAQVTASWTSQCRYYFCLWFWSYLYSLVTFSLAGYRILKCWKVLSQNFEDVASLFLVSSMGAIVISVLCQWSGPRKLTGASFAALCSQVARDGACTHRCAGHMLGPFSLRTDVLYYSWENFLP